MNRLEAMSVFTAVVEAGSLSAAGRRLHMPLATVSRKLSELEKHIGARLLTRSTRKLDLTDSGQAYLAACRHILEQVGEAERAAAGEYQAPRGELIVAAPLVFGRLHVLPLISEFLCAYPEVNVRLMLSDRVVSFWDEHVDAAVRIGALPDSTLVATRVGSVRSVVCASPAYLRTRGTPRRPSDLTRHSCISFTLFSAPQDHWVFGGGKAAISVPVQSRLSVNTAEAAVDAAIAGVGLARLLSYQVQAPVLDKSLTVVLRKFEAAPLPVHLIHGQQKPLPLKLRAFLDFMRPHLITRLEALNKLSA
ncbi:DNA-binding transcriptional regulator, LysR family [Solimonas aquatica]|uniref:DNA-binding transcriptional regulator, LysR family n=1 Tax=Solimonas aquatica TaxID=489703 RepID=A0A1H9FZJ8_9GAMM|nr:LysR family transcriptional regulator [Solimonas aquatica]SEQ43300.1 DNA-binding transcriptional regulator, LysR family [Solimonas aquatica]